MKTEDILNSLIEAIRQKDYQDAEHYAYRLYEEAKDDGYNQGFREGLDAIQDITIRGNDNQ